MTETYGTTDAEQGKPFNYPLAAAGGLNLFSVLAKRRRMKKARKIERKLYKMQAGEIEEQRGLAQRSAAEQAAATGGAGGSAVHEKQRRISAYAARELRRMKLAKKRRQAYTPSGFEEFLDEGAQAAATVAGAAG